MPPGKSGTPQLVAMILNIPVGLYRFYQNPVSSGFSLIKYGFTVNESYCLPGGLSARIDTLPVRTFNISWFFINVSSRIVRRYWRDKQGPSKWNYSVKLLTITSMFLTCCEKLCTIRQQAAFTIILVEFQMQPFRVLTPINRSQQSTHSQVRLDLTLLMQSIVPHHTWSSGFSPGAVSVVTPSTTARFLPDISHGGSSNLIIKYNNSKHVIANSSSQ